MDIEELRDYALSFEGVTEGFPFGETALVFKAGDKMFLLIAMESSPLQFNAKCDPDRALELREQYECVQPGYHMNKKHWNTVIIDGMLSNVQLKEMIADSYKLVYKKRKQKLRP